MKTKVTKDGDFSVGKGSGAAVSEVEHPMPEAQLAHKVGLSTFFNTNTRKCTSDFQSMSVDVEENSFSVTFGITHKIRPNNLLDIIDGIPEKFHFRKERHLVSFLKFDVVREGDDLFLNLKYHSYPEIFDYDLKDLLKIIDSQLICNDSHISTYIPMKGQNLTVRDVAVNPSRGEHVSMLNCFIVDCLARFEELTTVRDEEAYNNCNNLKDILVRIATNYKSVSQEDFANALDRLAAIENSELFTNDPSIMCSYKDIRPALNELCEKALTKESGVLINRDQLDLFLQELKKHESMSNETKAWFSKGTIEQLEAEIQSFLEAGVKKVI